MVTIMIKEKEWKGLPIPRCHWDPPSGQMTGLSQGFGRCVVLTLAVFSAMETR
jgi:hypothetical protein